MLFLKRSISRAPYKVLWESKALAPLQHESASKIPLYRVWHCAAWHQFALALAPEVSNLCPRIRRKKAVATMAHLCEEEEAQPGLRLISVQEESSQCCMGFQLLCMKSQKPAFSDKYNKGISWGLRIWFANQGPKYKQEYLSE